MTVEKRLICPQGHTSDEPDFCSVCGIQMVAPPVAGELSLPVDPGTTTAPGPPSGRACPSCGTMQEDPTARFCEVCRYDFQSGAPGPPPVAELLGEPGPAAADPASAAPSLAPAAPSPPPDEARFPTTAGPADWEVVIDVDPSLDVDPDPAQPVPGDRTQRLFPVDLTEMLIGRRDDAHNIRPEIPVFDASVSRRHAHLLRRPNGGLAIIDLASANGTAVNGAELLPGQPRDLGDGDVVTMGRWTRITIRRRGGSA